MVPESEPSTPRGGIRISGQAIEVAYAAVLAEAQGAQA